MTATGAAQAGLAALLVLTAFVVQVTALAPLHLPLGGTPDLVLIVVVALGLLRGPVAGAGIGFGAGLLVDLAPPSESPAGLWALVLCVVGHLAGLAADEASRSTVGPLVVVAGLAALAVAGFCGLSVLLGRPGPGWGSLVGVTLSTAAYTVVLAPFVVPAVTRLSRMLEPDTARR